MDDVNKTPDALPDALSVRDDVQMRYGAGAQAVETALCCPVEYDPRYLKIIPPAVLERDYGCGDPSRYVRTGETVLDLGSGGGKICFIAAQIVGADGRVIGVDMTDEMLSLARQNMPVVADQLGYANVEFRRGHIENLKLDLDQLNLWLSDNPVKNVADFKRLEAEKARLESELPMIADNSVDVIVSNCVLNLVSDDKKTQLFSEMFRVLKPGGRIAVSDIVSDKQSPLALKTDPRMWSGCISGALTETGFVNALEAAGFHGIYIDKFDTEPWQTVKGIEYRSATYLAYKSRQDVCEETSQALIYKGPWRQVEDDGGHVFRRGTRSVVSRKTFDVMQQAPYADMFYSALPSLESSEKDISPRRGERWKDKLSKSKKITGRDQTGGCC